MDVMIEGWFVPYLFLWAYLLAWWAVFRLPMRRDSPARLLAVIAGVFAAVVAMHAMAFAMHVSTEVVGTVLTCLLYAAPFLIAVGLIVRRRRRGSASGANTDGQAQPGDGEPRESDT